MQCIFSAAAVASSKHQDERHYVFLKRLTQVLTGLGTQLCTLWGKDEIGQPPNFAMYLDAILTFTQHSSLQLANYANSLWMLFFKHDQISQDPILVSFIPKWVESAAPKVMKVGYPSWNNSPTCIYSSMDFDSDEEFSMFFHRCRTDFLDTFRLATMVAPMVTYSYMERWLLTQIDEKLEGSVGSDNGLCNLQSPAYLQWDALSAVLDCVLSRILVTKKPKPPVGSGLHLLEKCLIYDTKDPLILSTLLSCISALFVFLSMAPDNRMLPKVLNKIFAALVFNLSGQTKDTRSRAVKNVRRHAASLMVKISQRYPLLLLPMFDYINGTVKSLNQDPEELSTLEKVTLQESLLLISNHFCEYEKQTAFVKEVIVLGAEQWLAMGEAFENPHNFMTYVGLDKPPVEPSSDDVNGQNRSLILFCINLFLAVLKRCAWPDDPDKAQKGGFIVEHTESGNPIYRNPAAPHIVPLLPQLFSVVRVFNALWLREALDRLSEGYAKAHGMLEVDKNNLLGISMPPVDPMDLPRPQTPLDRMQRFLTMVHDNCYHILGNAGPSLGRDFYQLPNLAASLITSAFSNLDAIPDYRLRPIVRVFMKPFIHSCPASYYETIVMPILANFCSYSKLKFTYFVLVVCFLNVR